MGAKEGIDVFRLKFALAGPLRGPASVVASNASVTGI